MEKRKSPYIQSCLNSGLYGETGLLNLILCNGYTRYQLLFDICAEIKEETNSEILTNYFEDSANYHS